MIEINNTTKTKIENKLIRKVSERFLLKYKLKNRELSIAFIGDKKIRELNSLYRKKDKITDVLSFSNIFPLTKGEPKGVLSFSNIFPLTKGEPKGVLDNFLGEILINPNQIKRQAKDNNNTFKQELIFILVHGLLHLVGYTDETEKKRLKMIKLGEEFIIID